MSNKKLRFGCNIGTHFDENKFILFGRHLDRVKCPYYSGNSMCKARSRGLYVPPEETVFNLCKTSGYSSCPEYKKASKKGIIRSRKQEMNREKTKAREPPE